MNCFNRQGILLQTRVVRTILARSSAESRRLFAATSVTTPTARRRPTKRPRLWLKAGMPFVLFSILSAWVVSNALDGKLKEMEASQGRTSKSLRQVALEQEHDEMMERLNKIVATDFDNQKRIKRPHEILEERRKERERRNAWHRRLYRNIFGEKSDK